MSEKLIIGLCLGEVLILLLLLAGVVIYCKQKNTKLLNRIRRMLDDAVAGKFVDTNLDESKISEIESSMWRFLCDCKTSSYNYQSQQQKIQELISDISHQTITPISNIKIYLELLEERLSDNKASDTEALEETAAICEQVDKLDFLIHSLVKLSRLETGIITVNPQQECIQKVLTTVERQYRPKAERKKILFLIEQSEEKAVFDTKWTEEAIGNIIDNAIKYTQEGGSITVRAEAYSMFLRIDIIDNGMGISDGEHSKIFSRFYRSPSVSRKPGVGIGLFLAREVVKAQKGYIKVSSRRGEGSRFSVFIPR